MWMFSLLTTTMTTIHIRHLQIHRSSIQQNPVDNNGLIITDKSLVNTASEDPEEDPTTEKATTEEATPESTQTNNVNTGDNSPVAIMLFIFMAAIGISCVIVVKGKKKENK